MSHAYPKERLILSTDKIHVFLYQLSLFNSQEMRQYLSGDECKRADRLKIEQKRAQFIITRSLLRLMLSRSLDKQPQDIEFSYEEHGKPILKDHPQNKPIEFNISHSGDFALIAITLGHKVGVDIEQINSRTEYQSLSNRFFSDKERTELLALDKQQQCDAFYRVWARKESFIKATGQGIGFGLDKFSVPVDENISDGRRIITFVKTDAEWFCYDLMKLDNYKTALTTTANNRVAVIFPQ